MLMLSGKEEKTRFAKIDLYLIMVEAVAITLFIIGSLAGTQNTFEAIKFLIAGPLAPWFWIVTILGGIFLPLLLEGMEVMGKVKYSVIVPLLVLAGSISLRFIVVYAGQMLPVIS